MSLKKEDEFALKIINHIQEMFDEDSECENKISKEDLTNHTTEFIHALANIAPSMIYETITNSGANILEFNHICNKLCFQFSTLNKD